MKNVPYQATSKTPRFVGLLFLVLSVLALGGCGNDNALVFKGTTGNTLAVSFDDIMAELRKRGDKHTRRRIMPALSVVSATRFAPERLQGYVDDSFYERLEQSDISTKRPTAPPRWTYIKFDYLALFMDGMSINELLDLTKHLLQNRDAKWPPQRLMRAHQIKQLWNL